MLYNVSCVSEAADKDPTLGSIRVGWRIQQLSKMILLSNVLFTVEECVFQPLDGDVW